MSLSTGTRLGVYEVTAQIGEGGMGQVYRARDTKLHRDVAIKVLPDLLASDPERLVRFQREAQVLASLNHPNIAQIHGLEESRGVRALVMELVEGEDLSQRIVRGASPLDEVLLIAKQIADAVEAAHEQGIIHRDLKPANIKVRPDGRVKVLDFGIAKALSAEPNALSSRPLSMSPTITSPGMMTGIGVILGTAAYMSPEQARGKPVDRRSDIWAFGCVLYEMLTGKAAFHGDEVTDTLAAVMRAEPDWSLLPAPAPPSIRALLHRCLQKDTRQRLQAIGDARIALEEVLTGAAPSTTAPRGTPSWKLRLAVGLGGILIAAAVGFAVWNLKPSPALPRPVIRFTIALAPGQALAGLNQPALALSADGSQLAYVATTTGHGAQQIYLRAMDGVDARPIPGTEGATDPFFSPDGQWLGFFAGDELKKISVRGGVAQTLTSGVGGGLSWGASWVSEGTIVFAPYSSVLQRVSDAGGASRPLTRFETGETLHMWPQALPGGKAVLFTVFSDTPTAIAVQPIGTGERRNLFQGQQGNMPSYALSGHLIYLLARSLIAVPFDLERLEVRGEAVPVVQGVLQLAGADAAQYSLSATGSLAYVSGTPQASRSELVWVGRNGMEHPIGAPARFYIQPRLSPDGRRVAVDVIEKAQDMQVWLYDLTRDTFAPFTFRGLNRHAVWTPDGKRIAFMSNRDGMTQIFWQLADGSGGLQRLTDTPPRTTADVLSIPYSWSPDGQSLSFVQVVPTKEAEFWILHVGNPSAPSDQVDRAQRMPIQMRGTEGAPHLSPDGRWLAYASDESGRRQIYVQPYPGPGGKWQISTDGGNEPQWSRNGKELFYRSGNKMMAVDIATQTGFAAAKPRQLFEGRYMVTSTGWARPNYDVSPDGQRFLMLKPVEPEQAPVTQINVVLNWSEELKRLAPAK
jgi:eukaryotic-like serine/threonine-protein kinase